MTAGLHPAAEGDGSACAAVPRCQARQAENWLQQQDPHSACRMARPAEKAPAHWSLAPAFAIQAAQPAQAAADGEGGLGHQLGRCQVCSQLTHLQEVSPATSQAFLQQGYIHQHTSYGCSLALHGTKTRCKFSRLCHTLLQCVKSPDYSMTAFSFVDRCPILMVIV